MASPSKPNFFIFTILFSVNILGSNAQSKPDAFHIPITVDTKTHQYYASFTIGTVPNRVNPNNVNAVIDLGGRLLSLACDTSSSTLRFVPCESSKCKDLKATVCDSNDTCSLPSFNPFSQSILSGRLSDDVVEVHETDGRAALSNTLSTHLDISCVNSSKLNDLAEGTDGILGLGRSSLSLTIRLSSAFNVVPKFGLCLPSSNEYGFGDLFIGRGPYMFPGDRDALNWLDYTPLVQTPHSDEYFVDVKSIKIDNRVVHFDSSLLSLNAKTGLGGTKINTAAPYSVLHSSIYKAVVDAFGRSAAARNVTRVASVEPFGSCFSVKGLRWTMGGPRVPLIDLELAGRMRSVVWRIHGANSMVRVNKDTLCLGFVDGGSKAKASIVLGGHQLEDNFLLFDLSTSMIGFSSSLLPRSATCSHFRNL